LNVAGNWFKYFYDAYGRATVHISDWSQTPSVPWYDTSFLFADYFRDRKSELYHVRNRTYYPALGR